MAQGYDDKVDVIEFNKMYNVVKSPETTIDVKESTAKQAIELYKGEFLPGYYDEWIEELRSVLAHKYIEICEELLVLSRNNNNNDDIIFCADLLLQADNLHEEAYIAVIEAYSKSGNTNMAKKKFSQLLKNYEEEYGEKPPKSTLNQIQEILTED
jgi:DNA-binding SARP family transcriptional activator